MNGKERVDALYELKLRGYRPMTSNNGAKYVSVLCDAESKLPIMDKAGQPIYSGKGVTQHASLDDLISKCMDVRPAMTPAEALAEHEAMSERVAELTAELEKERAKATKPKPVPKSG